MISNFIFNFKSKLKSKKIIHIVLTLILILICILSITVILNLKNIFPKWYSNSENINISFVDNVDNINNLSNNFKDIKYINLLNKKSKEICLASLSIPKLGLYNIQIKEGVEMDIIENNIGHFKETPWENGNVGLASHNRGATKNYFSNINKLNIGDEIYYTYLGIKRRYIVSNIVKIDSYDWSYLVNTNNNMLTLITCVSGYENLRLCVQAVESKKN